MKAQRTAWIGIIGVSLFIVSSIVGGWLIEGYSPISQFISEAYAIDTQYGSLLRFIGFIPSGILIALFCFSAARYFKTYKLSWIGIFGVGVFYGIGTIIVSIFPCDSGCTLDFNNPSISQLIHNFTGFLTYLIVPFCILFTGIGIQKSSHLKQFSKESLILGILSFAFFGLLIGTGESEYKGLIQRLVEATFALWIVSCAFALYLVSKV